ncbi:MAG TPA: inositol monophosphatase family protein [Bacteriovoracaceae bacterium]|nr:inositol monophosphatase family protein [Bacteriovoracaceae bacterium]
MKKIKTAKVNLNKVLEQMMEWSEECGKILNYHLIKSYKGPLKIINKGSQGLATEADVLSEAYVMGQIKRHYPDHKILSEEDAFTRQLKMEGVEDGEYLWLIDPLDGTNNFFNKIPLFAVSLALNKGNETLVGIVFNPVNRETFYAIKGKGAWLIRVIGDKTIKVRLKSDTKKKVFKEALLSANLSSHRVEKDLVKRFPEVRAMRRLGSAALEMSYVGAGMLDAYWEYKLQPWDMAAAGLICQEAGVKISTIKGGAYDPFSPSVLVSHPALFTALKGVLNKN